MESLARMSLLLYLVSVTLTAVLAVDRGNFKTCDQSGFCKRHHNMAAGESPYKALLDTLDVGQGSLKLQVLNKQTQVRFLLTLSSLQGNMARVRITEAEPLIPRYEPPVGDVLLQEPPLDSLSVEKQSADGLTLNFGKSMVLVQAEPLRIDVVVNNELLVSINSRGLLKFEHTRRKEETANDEEPKPEDGEEPPPEGEQPPAEPHPPADEGNQEPEEPGMWQETFKSHTDTKPNGPQSIGLDFSFPGFEHVYGIPEHADSLALKSTKSTDPYRLYNLDVFEYEVNTNMALYGSIPFMLAHNEKSTVGLFWLNAAETWVDVNSNTADKNIMSKLVDFVKGGDDMPQIDTHWFSESGIIDAFILLGPQPLDVLKQYATLTGTTPLPPLFGISYHQCRWNYNDQQDVANVDAGFDQNDIPMDVIWLDIEHTNGKRYFTWDTNRFPDSAQMIHNVSAKGRKMVTVVDPHLKKVSDFTVYQTAVSEGHLVKDKNGNDYDGWCWPGSSSWPDFISPAVRQFWANMFHLDQYQGSTTDLFTWNDMNEPSVFNGPEITMHKDARHFGNWEHRDVHNIYGLYVHQATAEGLVQRDPNQRPFVLSRAAYAGTQRWGAVWTGDNTGEWPHLKMSVPMILSLSLAGITFSGADVGGFFKNPETELLVRWYQAGCFQPFFRAHAHHDTRRREPWLFEENVLNEISRAVRTRYTYLPFWYTLFYHNEQDGSPPFRPLWLEFPQEKVTFDMDHIHMVGSALLVHPVTDAGATGVSTYLPGADELWYDLNTRLAVKGGATNYMAVTLSTIPVYQRGGYIVPRKLRRRRASSLMKDDPFTLVITLDKQGSASGDLYIDDYNSFEYRKGKFLHRMFQYSNGKLKSTSAGSAGSYVTREWLERVVVMGVQRQPASVDITSTSVNGHLGFKYDPTSKTLEIRKPGVNIAEDFTITLM